MPNLEQFLRVLHCSW